MTLVTFTFYLILAWNRSAGARYYTKRVIELVPFALDIGVVVNTDADAEETMVRVEMV
jgi:hypothetical protein